MKPIPGMIQAALVMALSALCVWQWHREKNLRTLVDQQHRSVQTLTAEQTELLTRVKAADAEILRLTGNLSELRTNSIPKQEQEQWTNERSQLAEAIEKQNATIKQLNEMILQANASMQTSNETLTKLTAERDSLAKKLNDVTAKYNALVKPKSP
jgi:chromosome segregation ATPase